MIVNSVQIDPQVFENVVVLVRNAVGSVVKPTGVQMRGGVGVQSPAEMAAAAARDAAVLSEKERREMEGEKQRVARPPVAMTSTQAEADAAVASIVDMSKKNVLKDKKLFAAFNEAADEARAERTEKSPAELSALSDKKLSIEQLSKNFNGIVAEIRDTMYERLGFSSRDGKLESWKAPTGPFLTKTLEKIGVTEQQFSQGLLNNRGKIDNPYRRIEEGLTWTRQKDPYFKKLNTTLKKINSRLVSKYKALQKPPKAKKVKNEAGDDISEE